MPDSNHTPGPWRSEEDFGQHWVSAGKGKKKITVASVQDVEVETGSGEVDTDTEATRANARLIAAAPNLLAVCVALVEDDDIAQGYGGLYAHLNKLRDMARAAIAKVPA